MLGTEDKSILESVGAMGGWGADSMVKHWLFFQKTQGLIPSTHTMAHKHL